LRRRIEAAGPSASCREWVRAVREATVESLRFGPEGAGRTERVNGRAESIDEPVSSDRTIRTSKTALYLTGGLTFESWKRVGGRISLVQMSSAWWIGDWLNYGQAAYGRRYREATEITGLDYQTLRNYAWVASRFQVSRRRDNLSFQHHAEVAALPEPDQETWLLRASTFGWSRNELRRRIRSDHSSSSSSSSSSSGGLDGPPAAVVIKAGSKQRQRWLEAAVATGQEFSTWVAAALDRAADAVLAEPSLAAAPATD
jgi:hypothetical protein